MDALQNTFLFLHFLGLASIIGGFLAMAFGAEVKRASAAMLHASWLQLVTGLAMVGMLEGPLDETPDHAKVGVKLTVLVLVLASVLLARRREDKRLYQAAALLTVVNIAVAVFWT